MRSIGRLEFSVRDGHVRGGCKFSKRLEKLLGFLSWVVFVVEKKYINHGKKRVIV